jgi:hypothetical protein
VKKSVLFGLIVSVPLVVIEIAAFGRLFGALTDHSKASPAALLAIFGGMVALFLVWVAVALINREKTPQSGKMPFDVAAAIAIAEAQKKGPPGKCPSCGRTKLSEKAPRCLHCGASFVEGEKA